MHSATALLLLALVVPAIFASACNDNCLSDKCDNCVCGNDVSIQNAKTICAQYSWNQEECMCALTHASGANANSVSYRKDGSIDVGLFQINSGLWSACSNGKAPCSVSDNLQCAIQMYKAGGDSFSLFESYAACKGEATSTTKHPTTSTTAKHTTHVSTAHAANSNSGNSGNSGNGNSGNSNSGNSYGAMFSDVEGLKGGKGNTPKDTFAQKFEF